MLYVYDRVDDRMDLLNGGDNWKCSVITQERHFVFIPVPFQHVVPEVVKLGDMYIDCAVADLAYIAQIIDI